MNKRKKLLFSILIGVFVIFGMYNLVIKFYDFKLISNSTYEITIHNKTNTPLKQLELRFYNGDSIKQIENIEPKKVFTYNLNTEKIRGESSIYLTYKDNKNNMQEVCIVGYLEKGYGGREKIKIKNINKDGILEIQ